MFFYLGEKIQCVEEDIRLAKNKVKSWKYGYNEQIDTVIISQNGTLGDCFVVNGLRIGLPEMPSHTNIANHNKTIKNQFWQRENMPKELTLSTEHKHEEYINKEFERRTHGLWIYINGKPIYISKTYYFFIQWVKENNEYPNFRVIQNELMLYWEACVADNRCFGICFVKPRRFGWSALCLSELLESGIRNENKTLGIISKTGNDAKKIFGRMVRSFKRLPYFFMPETDGTTTPKTELIFAEPSRKRKIGEEIIAGDGLDTTITWHNTQLNAMDGDAIFRSMIDEIGKFQKECPASEYWSIVQTSHTQGRTITGKSMMGSTVNAMKKGGAEFKSIYEDSDPLDRQDTGRTKSGLYRLFISTKYCLAGFFDIYGFSIIDDPTEPIMTDEKTTTKIGSVTFLKKTLEVLKTKPDKYNERLRQFPNTDRDAFRDEASDCNFNLTKLIDQIDYNDFELNDKFDGEKTYYGNNAVERGNLMWENGIPFSNVYWQPDYEKGRFFIAKDGHPPKEYMNKREMKKVNGHTSWTPLAGHVGAFGADPYNRSQGVDGRGSKGAITGMTKYNTSVMPNDFQFLEYLDRARTVTEYFDDVVKACVYYSMPVLGELSNEAFLKYLKDNNFRNFSLNNPFKKYHELSPTEKELGGAPPQDAKIADAQFYAVEHYIENYIGYAEDDSNRPINQIGAMHFTRTLIQLKEVDLQKRTAYDAYISFSLALLANQNKKVVEEKPRVLFKNPYAIYDNTGQVSKLINNLY